MTDIQELYESRKQDIIDTCNHREPKVVPVMANVLTWAVGYAKSNTNYLLDNLDKVPEVCTEFFKDVYYDAYFAHTLSTPIRSIERLGGGSYFVSNDGCTIQHKENCVMESSDYPDLINNTKEFLINTLGTRKFPELQKSKEDAYKALVDAALYIDRFNTANEEWVQLVKEKYGIVGFRVGGHTTYPTMDVIFDRLRGVTGCLMDIRRNREDLIKATEALKPIYFPRAIATSDFPYGASTLHCPMFISKPDFDELFWPCFKEMLLDAYNRGCKTLLFLEGNWERHFETMLEDLPQSSVLLLLEDDDVIRAKKLVGHKFTIIGGVTADNLRYKTKQECLDDAKRIIDECAPGGGFIFSVNKSLITHGEIVDENLIAVNEFVHEYGKY